MYMYRKQWQNGYSIQGLVAMVKDTVAILKDNFSVMGVDNPNSMMFTAYDTQRKYISHHHINAGLL